MNKLKLAEALRKELKERHGTLLQASEDLGISYDRLRKAMKQNRFSSADLELLMPGEPISSLKEIYSFRHVRAYRAGAPSGTEEPFATRLFEDVQTPFSLVKRAASETDFGNFVENLYENLHEASMVLFCHETAEPLEWKSDARDASRNIRETISRGGFVLYVMESDLKNQVVPTNETWDGVDDDFRWFLKAVQHAQTEESASASDTPAGDGFVALLRVKHCSFCIPHQKPALFSRVDVAGMVRDDEHYAVTTIDIPTSWDGKFSAGTTIIPMKSDMTLAMRNYLFQLAIFLREHISTHPAGGGSSEGDLQRPGRSLDNGLRFQSFPPVEWKSILQLLERIADL